jgi:hypothetical protein
MNTRIIILGGCLFATGVLLAEGWQRMRTKEPTAPPTTSGIRLEAPETATFSSIGEAILKAPELVLEDLSNDPYLRFTDAELEILAETIDLRKESHRRLLDQVTPPNYSQELWIAVIRANVGKMPLKELLDLSHKGRARSSKHYLPLVEAVQASPDRKEILSTWGRGFLQAYSDHAAAKMPDLKEAMDTIPSGVTEPEMREELLNSWLYYQPTAANMEAIFKLPPEHMRMQYVMEGAASRVWTKTPEDRQEVLAGVSELNGPQRNRILASLTYATKPDDPAGMASVLSRFTSYEHQRQATESWLKKQDEGGRQKLMAELDALPDNSSTRRLRASLKEKVAGE